MRPSSLLAVMFSCVCPLGVYAQSAEAAVGQKPSTAEIGIFGQTEFSQSNVNLSMAGIQFKKWMNEHVGFRVLGGYASYDALQVPFFIGGAQGEAVEHYVNHRISLGMLGVSVEAQRQFYKRLYLFAALELKGGYGTGSGDTIVKTASRHHGHYEASWDFNNGAANATMTYLDFMPSIGAKIQFSKLAFGVEVSGVMMNYTSISTGNVRNGGMADFSAGGYMVHRGFISYRL